MKPQDILVYLKILLWKKGRWTVAALAESIGLSASETHGAIQRGKKAGLFDPLTEKPVKSALEEFLLHGIRYAFPAEPGRLCRGVPTSHSAPPLAGKIVSGEPYVWPDDNGRVRGQAIEPLYRSVPAAARKDVELYELLALIDALRVGRARERSLAAQEISKRLKAL